LICDSFSGCGLVLIPPKAGAGDPEQKSVWSEGNVNQQFARSVCFQNRAVPPVLALVLAVPLIAAAQGNNVRPRITDRVDNSRLTTLRGNTHPLARPQFDQGAAPPNLPMNRILLALQRSPEQQAALQGLLVQQQTTSSPNFHKWLTPDEFGQQFGPADADIQIVTSWLGSFGFQSIRVSRGRTTIEFSGTAAQVEAALHTPIHRYVVNGESHWANANDPQIPAALAPVVSGIVSLHNFPKKPASVRSGRTATLTRTPEGKPLVNLQGGEHALAPADFNTIYSIGSTMTGSGVTIGIIARSNIVVQDVADFRSTFGLPSNNPQIILNGPDPGDLGGGEEAEAVLDATWTGAVAPNATVDLVVSEATNAAAGEDLSEIYIINNNLADIMTESFSVCEAAFGTSLSAAAAFYSGAAEQAAAQGITFLVASGDGGPDSCDNPSPVPTTAAAASVNILAATPFTIAVGGTQFNDVANPSTYWNSTNGTNSESAKSYIPENVWNESCTVAQCGASLAGLWSSGGGQSMVFSKPSWQTGVTGIPSGNRALPDVSLSAADHDGYLLCISASCHTSNQTFQILSGTSASDQAFGGVMALVAQQKGRQGQANYVLYNLAGHENFSNCNASTVPSPASLSSCVFNDVTIGNTNLTIVNESGFAATVGYDEATGLGSVNVTNLLANWSSAITNGSTTTLRINTGTAPFMFSYGQLVSVTVSVAPTSGSVTPTGDVSLVASTTANGGVDFNSLTGGSVTWSTPFLPGGTYNLTAHYAGDGTFLGSSSTPVNVKVNPTTSLTRLALVTVNSNCGTSMSVPYGSGYVLAVAVVDSAAGINQTAGSVCAPTPTGAAPTGTVNVTADGAPLDGGTFMLNSGGFFEDQSIQLSVGTHNILATYNGDNSFSTSNATPPTVTVARASTTSAITSSPMSVAASQTFSVTAVIDTLFSSNPALGSIGVSPTGTVTFSATTAAALPARRRGPWSNPFLLVEVFAALAWLSLLLMMKGRRSVVLLLTTVVLVIALGTSCGSSNSNSNTTTTTLGTATLTGTTDANGFASATATLSTAMMTKSGTIAATYSGDGNYIGATSSGVSVTVH
jgi:subtilase family serine protease